MKIKKIRKHRVTRDPYTKRWLEINHGHSWGSFPSLPALTIWLDYIDYKPTGPSQINEGGNHG